MPGDVENRPAHAIFERPTLEWGSPLPLATRSPLRSAIGVLIVSSKLRASVSIFIAKLMLMS